MFCANCGRQIEDDSRFCTYCGQRVASVDAPADATTQLPGAADLTVQLPSQAAGGAPATVVLDAFPSSREMDAAFEPQTAPVPRGGFAADAFGVGGDDPAPAPPYPVQPTQELYRAEAVPKNAGPVPEPRVYKDPPGRSTRRNIVIALIIVLAIAAAAVWWFALRGSGADQPSDEPPAATQPVEAPSTSEQGAQDQQGQAPADEPAQTAPAQEEQPQQPVAGGDYIIADSSTRYLAADELQSLSDRDLWLARNEIYARHGRKFNNSELQSYFDSKSWYTPRYSAEEFESMESPLNEYETANADLIYEVEAQRGSSYVK